MVDKATKLAYFLAKHWKHPSNSLAKGLSNFWQPKPAASTQIYARVHSSASMLLNQVEGWKRNK
jgi:hypothetical protein